MCSPSPRSLPSPLTPSPHCAPQATLNESQKISVLPTFEEQVGKTEANPVPDFFTSAPPGTPGRHELTLERHQKLYIPRGGVHYAQVKPGNEAETSVHLTVAVPTQYLSERYGVGEILKDAPGLLAGFDACACGSALEKFKGGEGGGLADFMQYLQSKLSGAEVRSKIEAARRNVILTRDQARQNWHRRYVEADKAGVDRGGHVTWSSTVRWLGGKSDDENGGELEVAESIADAVMGVVGRVRGAGKEGVKVAALQQTGSGLDDLTVLLLAKVLVQLWACELVDTEMPAHKKMKQNSDT